MPSPSSKGSIASRAIEFCHEIGFDLTPKSRAAIFQQIQSFFAAENELIPEKERIGKGSVFIARGTAEGVITFLNEKFKSGTNLEEIIEFCRESVSVGNAQGLRHLYSFGIFLLAEFCKTDFDRFEAAEPLFLAWATIGNWEIHEMALECVVNGLKYYPEAILPKLRIWIHDGNPNIRRLVTEGSRPRGNTKWLRDPQKNQPILEMLAICQSDTSEYVRKSVGNNLKDLSKYMPEKILETLTKWISEANIAVTNDLASKTKKELKEPQFNLIWITKFALRWLRDRNPEHHTQIKSILGEDYVKYYNEKKNIRARPSLSENED